MTTTRIVLAGYTAAYMFTEIVGFLCAGLAAAFVLRKCGTIAAQAFPTSVN